jgi:hypothetical protein
MRSDQDSGLGKLLQARMNTTPGSKEWTVLSEKVEKLDRQKKKRVPDERHKQRMSALYVDAISIGRWNRPTKEVSRAPARDFLVDAVNDYSIQRSRYTELQITRVDNPELVSALEGWSDRPELPAAEWPSYVDNASSEQGGWLSKGWQMVSKKYAKMKSCIRSTAP